MNDPVYFTLADFKLSDFLQLVVGASILFVWLFRANVPTNYRVGQAQTLREEVTEAGLPDYMYDVMRIIKPKFICRSHPYRITTRNISLVVREVLDGKMTENKAIRYLQQDTTELKYQRELYKSNIECRKKIGSE